MVDKKNRIGQTTLSKTKSIFVCIVSSLIFTIERDMERGGEKLYLFYILKVSINS